MIASQKSGIGQRNLKSRIFAILAAASLLLFGCTSPNMSTNSQFQWDLRQSNAIAQLGQWPDPSNTVFAGSRGEYSFKIQLPNDRSIDRTFANFSVLRDGDRISNINLSSKPLTAKEAETLAVDLAREQGLNPARFAKWAAEVAGPKTTFTPSAFVETPNENPSLVIKTGPSFNDERPWLIHLNVYWSPQ